MKLNVFDPVGSSLHKRALEAGEQALLHRLEGNEKAAEQFFKKAINCELQAAEIFTLGNTEDHWLAGCSLMLGAANLALEIKDYYKASGYAYRARNYWAGEWVRDDDSSIPQPIVDEALSVEAKAREARNGWDAETWLNSKSDRELKDLLHRSAAFGGIYSLSDSGYGPYVTHPMIIKALEGRPHIPNKQERRAQRQAAAKNSRGQGKGKHR